VSTPRSRVFLISLTHCVRARRTTVYVFFDRDGKGAVERLALGGDSNGGLYTVYRDPGAAPREIYGDTQWQLLKKARG